MFGLGGGGAMFPKLRIEAQMIFDADTDEYENPEVSSLINPQSQSGRLTRSALGECVNVYSLALAAFVRSLGERQTPILARPKEGEL